MEKETMKLYGMSALLVAALVASPAVAGAKGEKAPKTAKACAAKAKHGWKWEAGKCVKGEAPAKAAVEAKKAKPEGTPAPEATEEAPVEEGALEE